MFFPQLAFRLYYFPSLTAAWFAVTFITSYIWAVTNGHVIPLIPFISDTGSLPPESCLFGQMLNIGSLLMGATMYIRYRQINYIISQSTNVINEKQHRYSLYFGYMGCIGLSIVANFQETNALVVHLIGATMAFGIGMLYFILQALVSYQMRTLDINIRKISRATIYLRLFLGFGKIPLFFIVSFCSLELSDRFKEEVKTWDIEWWTVKKDSYEYRLAGNFAEWIIALFMIVFVLSFTVEFKALHFEGISFKFSKNPSAITPQP